MKESHPCIARVLIAAGIAAAIVQPMPGRASNGTIAFTGAVTRNSCQVQVNGSGNGDGTVALPVVDTTALDRSAAPQDTAAGSFFNIALSACDATHADVSGSPPTLVAIYFEAGPNVDPATSALINAGTSNVEVSLYLASEAAVVGTRITPGVADSGQPVSQPIDATGTQYFYAGYSTAANGAATPGSVSTSITYSLVYQ